MTSYELSISPDYVPSWGIVEAVREFFQNALDEETRDADNKMFFYYDPATQVLRIGNKYGKLDAKTLLLGYTQKSDKQDMIGNYGEGYKIATVVLLRLNKQVVFYNYGCRQVWRPRFVKSRRYGTLVPTFFVDNTHAWESVPDNDLVIEISGITSEEYELIKESNLHIQGGDYPKLSTMYGDILTGDDHKSKIFVGGLYICTDKRLDVGVDFHPNVVHLERDRSMVDGFDVQWYLSAMISETEDYHLISHSLNEYSGAYISYSRVSRIGDMIAKEFLDQNGFDAVPVSSEDDSLFCESPNTVTVSRAKKEMIQQSQYYRDNFQSHVTDESLISVRLLRFASKIKPIVYGTHLRELSDIIRDVQKSESASEDTDESAE